MTQDPSSDAAQPLSFVQRVIGVVVSPGETMARIAAAPRWFDVMALTTVLIAAGFALFFSTDIGKAAYVDQAVASIESFGGTVNEQMLAGVQRQAGFASWIQGASILFMGPIMAAAIAGILFGVFTVLGGEARYRQVLAVVAHAGVISLLQSAFTLPINYMRETMSSATNMAVFFPNMAEGSFLASVLGFIDLFWIWYLVVLAMGLAAVYRRKWTSVAGGLFVVYVLIGLAVAAIKAVLGGKMKRSTKRWLGAIVVLAIVAGLAYANFAYRKKTGKEVTVEAVQARDLTAIVSASGKIQAKRTVNISADNMGRVTQLSVEEGDRVKRGQFLMQIDPRNLASAVQSGEAGQMAARSMLDQQRLAIVSARENLALARSELKRQQELWAQQLTTRQELDRAENAVNVGEAELRQREVDIKTQDQRIRQEGAALNQAQYNLSKARIESPIDGIVSRRNIEEGETVVIGTMNNAGTVLLTIADMSIIEAEVEVDETDIPTVRLGQVAKVTIDALPGKEYTGKVTEIGNSPIQTTTGQAASAGQAATNFKVTVQLDQTIDEVRPGFTCSAEIETAKRAKAVAVPIQAMAVRDLVYDKAGTVIRPPKQDAKTKKTPTPATPAELPEGQTRKETEGVFVMREKNAEFVPVHTGIAGERYFEVMSGVKVGDKVITGPFNSVRDLQDGDEVRLSDTAADAAKKKS